jgi:predicted Zn-dependent protease
MLYLERARALEAAGGLYVDEAIDGLEEGLQLLGPIITLELYAVELETKRKNYHAALQRMDRIIKRSVRKDAYLVKRSEILMQAGQPEKARQDLQSAQDAIERLPNSRRKSRAVMQIETRIHQEMDGQDTNHAVEEEHKL